MTALEQLHTFTLDTLPTLDTVVIAALELFVESELPTIPDYQRPLVIGSGAAIVTGHILYNETSAVFADESNYQQKLAAAGDFIDGVVIISASGSKHAIEIAQHTSQHAIVPVTLLTCNAAAPAAEHVLSDQVRVFPKNREPYTNNVATYLGMILSKTKEDPSEILTAIARYQDTSSAQDMVEKYQKFSSYVFVVPTECTPVAQMIRIKFEEMFEPIVNGRAYGAEDIKHAKTVIPSVQQLIISLGVQNEHLLGVNDQVVQLPESASYGTVMALGYYLVGIIQQSHEPYFKNAIADYAATASAMFGQTINPIVE
jgi:hypothetical protein